MFGCASCVSSRQGVGCIQLSDRLHGVYTHSHKQYLERKRWSPRCARPYDPGAELLCFHHAFSWPIRLEETRDAGCLWVCIWDRTHMLENCLILSLMFMFVYGSKYKLSKSLFASLCMQVCNLVCVQVSDVDHRGTSIWESRDPQTPTCLHQKHLRLYIYNYSQTQEDYYICAAKSGKTYSSNLFGKELLKYSCNKLHQLWPYMWENRTAHLDLLRPSFHTGEANNVLKTFKTLFS